MFLALRLGTGAVSCSSIDIVPLRLGVVADVHAIDRVTSFEIAFSACTN